MIILRKKTTPFPALATKRKDFKRTGAVIPRRPQTVGSVDFIQLPVEFLLGS